MADQVKAYTLKSDTIAQVCDDIQEYFDRHHAQKRDAIRVRFLIEETLLNYRDKFGEDINFEYHMSNRLYKASVQLIVYSDRFNPFATDEEGVMSSLMLASSQQNPSWQYVKSDFEWLFTAMGRNEIVFSVPRESKTSNPVKILIGLACGALFSVVLRLILGAETSSLFANDFILPLANAYSGILCVMGILLTFFALPLCIVQYRNVSEFHNATKNTLKAYIKLIAFVAIVVGIFGLIFTGLDKSSTVDASVIKSIFDVFISFVPTSLITPFINFDCMQVMVIGLLFGLGFLAMGDRNKVMVEIFDRLNLTAVLVNSFFAKFVAIYVALMVCSIGLTSTLAQWAKYIGLIVSVVVGCIIFVLLSAITVCVKYKIPLKLMFEKFSESFLINLSSASVGASFINIFNELAVGCGVEGGYTGVAINLGTVIYKPMYSLFLAASAITAANLSGVLSMKVLIEIVILSMVLPATIPNIQGGAASVILLMLSQLGLGNEYAEIFISINALLQYIIVPANVFCMQCVVIHRAGKEDKLDVSVLQKGKQAN